MVTKSVIIDSNSCITMIMKKFFIITILSVFLLPNISFAQNLSKELSGRILINVDRNGEAWYVNPADGKRYFLGRPKDAFEIMRKSGLGISELNFQKIAQGGMPVPGDLVLAKQLSGKIVIRTERFGEAWYINPVDLKKYYLGRPEDAFAVMRKLGLGITAENLSNISKNEIKPIDQYSSFKRKTIKTNLGNFSADIITIDLNNPKLKIITDTADNYNCKSDCKAKSLKQYVKENKAFAAINGSYFDTGSAKRNYYFFPVYNSNSGTFVNEDQLKWWTTGPIMAFDQNNKFYYFKDSRDFKSQTDFESRYGVKLQAAIGNKPRLIENYMDVLIDWEVDNKQLTTKTSRNALAYKDGKLYLVVIYKATVPDLGSVMQEMKMEYAINIDGGYSTAMYYDDQVVSGPGRNVPNAILFSSK